MALTRLECDDQNERDALHFCRLYAERLAEVGLLRDVEHEDVLVHRILELATVIQRVREAAERLATPEKEEGMDPYEDGLDDGFVEAGHWIIGVLDGKAEHD